jgi:hypothetical protein
MVPFVREMTEIVSPVASAMARPSGDQARSSTVAATVAIFALARPVRLDDPIELRSANAIRRPSRDHAGSRPLVSRCARRVASDAIQMPPCPRPGRQSAQP